MKSRRLLALCGFLCLSGLLTMARPAFAQEYADWSQSIPLPYSLPGVTGNVSRADGSTLYVAGAELAVVDLTDPSNASVSGRLALPAPAADLRIRWPYAYAACGDAGLVEVDVTDPAAMRVTRVFAPGTAIDIVAVVGELVVAIDAESVVYMLGTSNDGMLEPISTYESPYPIVNAVPASGHLAVIERLPGYYVYYMLRIYDLSDPSAMTETDVKYLGEAVSYAYGSYPNTTFMESDGPRVVLSFWNVEEENYDVSAKNYMVRLMIDDLGQIDGIGYRALSRVGSLDVDGDRICVGTGTVTLYRFDDLGTNLVTGLPGAEVVLGDNCLVAIQQHGLGIVDLGPGENIQPLASIGGALARNGIRPNSFAWHPPLLLATNERSWYNGHLSGTTYNSIDYWLCDAGDPASLGLLTSGNVGGCYNDGGNPIDICYGLGSVSTAGPFGERFLLGLRQSGTIALQVMDISTRSRFDLPFLNSTDSYGVKVIAGSVWVREYFTGVLTRYDLRADDPTVPCAGYQLYDIGTMLGPDRDLMINALSDHVDVYDVSDPDTLMLTSSNYEIRLPWLPKYLWLGRKLVFGRDDYIQVADFSDPYAPELLDGTDLTEKTTGFEQCGSYFLIKYARGFHLAEITEDGRLSFVSPLVDFSDGVRFTSGPVVSGGVAYIGTDTDVRAYDIHDPANPSYIGRAVAGAGNVALVGDHLVSGNVLLPHDLHERTTPRGIAIDIKPTLKPGRLDHGHGLGVVPVAVYSDDGFDATTLDPATVRFGPAGAQPLSVGPPAAPGDRSAKGHVGQDLDGDGDLDLMFRFRLADTGLGPADVQATLTGRTFAGEEVAGTDVLRNASPDDVPPATSLALSPNPFNPQTTVRYSLAAAGAARVAVYDVRGRRVALLADGPHTAGAHEAVWRGADDRGRSLPSGTYFIRVEADGQVLTRKALLVK